MATDIFDDTLFNEQLASLQDQQAKRFQNQNVLSRYSSYSYRHVLFVCETTDVMDKIEQMSLHNIVEGTQRYFSDSAGDFVMLINGFYDTHYTIESFSVNTRLDQKDDPTLIATEIELEVKEMFGANLFNDLADISIKFNTDPGGLLYMLKTVFVGFTEDGDTEYITNVKPVSFVTYRYPTVFDASGAMYTFMGLPNTDGAATMPIYNETSNMTFEAAESVEYTLKNFQNALNEAVQKNKEKVDPSEQNDIVEYVIYLDDEYKTYEYKIDNIKDQFQEDGGYGHTKLSVGNNERVDKIINLILESSSAVLNDALTGEEAVPGEELYAYTPKIKRTVTVTKETSGRKKYKIVFNVVRHRRQFMRCDGEIKRKPDNPKYVQQINNPLFLSYIYSGSNVDIIDMDMNWEDGMMYLYNIMPQSVLRSKQQSTENEQSSDKDKSSTPTKDSCNRGLATSVNKPTTAARSLTTGKNTEKRFPHETAAYYMATSFITAMQNVQTTVTIRGNPFLHNDFIRMPSEAENLGQNDANEKQFFNDWEKVPAYTKLDIYFPHSGMSILDENYVPPGYPQDQQLVPFWYQDFYFIEQIDSSFDNGTFTQTLTLRPMFVNWPTIKDKQQQSQGQNQSQGQGQNGSDQGSSYNGPDVNVTPNAL